ncbi:MAG TPA: UDP-glucose 4-epimerase GalE [Dongiaceae bacterium]|jgi:UDP-glucose 4-epimerase|nr:UDP-glucose 4-epimerase GalE [Dongiaceae bacterium]
MGKILVTGGAGYIGSHTVWALHDAGYRVVVIDDLSTGRADCLPQEVPLIRANIGETATVAKVLQSHDIEAILHFAGSIIVPESVEKPLLYYRNNTLNSHALLETALKHKVKAFIFSSTAAVYGVPRSVPVKEDAPLAPISPYGHSKFMVEQMLADAARVTPLRYASLRYFNVAGADAHGRTGQCSPIATHLIKLAAQVATGTRARLAIFGDDYPTKDGTCIRDYIHVTDLAQAHVAALDYLRDGGTSFAANCAYGKGYSVLDIIHATECVTGCRLPTFRAPRRPGDPPELVADASYLQTLLQWRPAHDSLHTIVKSAIQWEKHIQQTAPSYGRTGQAA